MKALSLFSGIGGIDLACEWAGIETVAFCEREPFCQKVLRKHWPDTPIYDDVCTLTKERLEQDGIDSRTIDFIHGGYPCQPFSFAGNRGGAEDDRHLWPEVFRLIQAIQPRWFVGENVIGHVTLGLDIVLSDLDSIGYAWEAFIIPAAAVNAPHRRERVFIVAYPNSIGCLEHKGFAEKVEQAWNERFQCEEVKQPVMQQPVHGSHKTFANTTGKPSDERKINAENGTAQTFKFGSMGSPTNRSTGGIPQPTIRRVDDGISRELDEDRLKALGNAVVPQQIWPILQAIKSIDDLLRSEASGGNTVD